MNRISKEPAEVVLFSEVGKTFGEMVATTGISTSIREGEIITIVGPSGCGKSTMLNMVAGLLKPTYGTVSYRGQEVAGINERCGYMTQSDHLLPWRTVQHNISVPLEIKGVPRGERNSRIAHLTNLVGLGGFERSYPPELSGGMRKRTALARLLAYDPETLLLDEPFAALDAQLRIKMQMELLRVSRTLSKTVLFVTHDLDEAISIGDRCLVFSKRPGTIVKDINIPLPKQRDLIQIRRDPAYQKLCGELWETFADTLEDSSVTSEPEVA